MRGPTGPGWDSGTREASQALQQETDKLFEAPMTHTVTPETVTALPSAAITHTCGAWWTGLSRAHCPACHRTFSCDSAADRHRVGKHGIDRRCADPATVGLVAVDKAFGILWQNPGPEGGYGAVRRFLGDPDDHAEPPTANGEVI